MSSILWSEESRGTFGAFIFPSVSYNVAYKAPDTNSADIPADKDTGTETTGKTLYRVQVGAFSVKENAESFLQEVKALGLSNAFITEVKV